MWIIRYAVAAALIVGLLGFSIQNTSQTVQITIAAKHFYNVQLIFLIYIAFCIGLIFIIQYFKMASQLSEQKKKNRILTQEITTLRNLPLEEPDDKADSGRDQEEGS